LEPMPTTYWASIIVALLLVAVAIPWGTNSFDQPMTLRTNKQLPAHPSLRFLD